jgi:hypothetical protein
MGIGYNTSVVRDGLVLYLDAANSKSYPGSGTTTTDISNSAMTGQLNNGPIFQDKNIFFDGVDDHINLGTQNALKVTSSVTICAWIYITATNEDTSYRAIIGNGTGGRNYNFYVKGSGSGLWQMHLSNSYSGNLSPFTGSLSSFSMIRNRWYFVCGVIGIENNRHIYYVDGNETNNFGVASMTSLSASTGEYYVGRADNYFRGNIGLIQLYNKVLTPQEIKLNFEATRGRYGI